MEALGIYPRSRGWLKTALTRQWKIKIIPTLEYETQPSPPGLRKRWYTADSGLHHFSSTT